MVDPNDLRNKAELEYLLNEHEDLEAVLDQTELDNQSKEQMIEVAKHIYTAKVLIEQNPYATNADRQYLKDTENKYQELKDEWRNEK